MKKVAIILLFTAICLSAYAQNRDAVIGQWVNATGEAHIDIYKKTNKYFGKLSWLKNPKDEQGRNKTEKQAVTRFRNTKRIHVRW
jgi:hypothetical protein